MPAAVSGDVSPPGMREVELSIRGMTCAACAARVQKKLSGLDDVTAAVNFATGKATVTAPGSLPVAVLIETVEQAGYGAGLAQPAAGAAGGPAAEGPGPDAARVAGLRRRLIVALVFFVPLSDLSVVLSLFPWSRFPGWQWLLIAMAAPVAGWAAWPFHRAALQNARHRAASMDTLVSMADSPNSTTPSAAITSPGRTITLSPGRSSATGTRRSAPSPDSTLASRAPAAASSRIASPASRRARASYHRPASKNVVTDAATSR